MKRFVIRRRVGVLEDELRPGEYIQCRRGELYGDVAHAIWRCPVCGVLSSCGRHAHSVNHDGEVNPSSVCPHKLHDGSNCTFHEHVLLEGWEPEPMGYA